MEIGTRKRGRRRESWNEEEGKTEGIMDRRGETTDGDWPGGVQQGAEDRSL